MKSFYFYREVSAIVQIGSCLTLSTSEESARLSDYDFIYFLQSMT